MLSYFGAVPPGAGVRGLEKQVWPRPDWKVSFAVHILVKIVPAGVGVKGPEKRPLPEIVKLSFRIDPRESKNPCKGVLFLKIFILE